MNSEGFGFPSVAFINEALGEDEPKKRQRCTSYDIKLLWWVRYVLCFHTVRNPCSAVPTSLCVVQCVHLFFMERNILKVCFCCGRPCFSLLRYFNVAEWCFYMEKKSLFSFYIVILFQINWSQLFSVCCCLWNPKDDANDSEYTHLRYKRLYTGKNNNNKGCV